MPLTCFVDPHSCTQPFTHFHSSTESKDFCSTKAALLYNPNILLLFMRVLPHIDHKISPNLLPSREEEICMNVHAEISLYKADLIKSSPCGTEDRLNFCVVRLALLKAKKIW